MIINNKKVDEIVKNNAKCPKKIKNVLMAFFFGGFLGIVGQGIYYLFTDGFKLNDELSTILVSASIIFITFIFTCLGIYDKYAKIVGAGAFIPITGFANAITSSALEGKSEGLIFGIGAKLFSLVGSVFTYGIVSSIILGFIYYFIKVINNA